MEVEYFPQGRINRKEFTAMGRFDHTIKTLTLSTGKTVHYYSLAALAADGFPGIEPRT